MFHQSLARARPVVRVRILPDVESYNVYAGVFLLQPGKLAGLNVEDVLALPAERIFDVGDMQKDDLSSVVAKRYILSIEVYSSKIRSRDLL